MVLMLSVSPSLLRERERRYDGEIKKLDQDMWLLMEHIPGGALR